MPRIYNKRRQYPTDNIVYVGRPSVWGNPFKIGTDGSRDEVIAKFEAAARADPYMLLKIKTELRGKDLLCWCAPLACHADVLLKIANED